MITIEDVKGALGITGNYQDTAIRSHFDEVVGYLTDAGVDPENITVGVAARGVSDLWNYGAGAGRLSDYFYERAKQLTLR